PKLGTVDVNDSFCKMLGYQRDEIIGKSPLDFVDEQNRKIFQKQTSQISSTDHRVYDITLKTKAGRDLPTIFHAATLRDSHGDILNAFALVTDLTEHNRSKEELIRAKKEAEEASQAKSTFLANMSHEIRTPMNAILGFAEILENYIHDKKQRYFLNAIESSGKTLLNLINDILDLSKVEAGKLDLEYTYVNLSSVFSDMQLIFSHRMKEKGLELIVEDISDFPNKVYLDESRLKQILLNLLGNALKFTDSGYVRLWSRFEYLEGNDSLIKLTVVVEDTGIGVSRDQKELIFNAFEQQKGQSSAKYGGTGLGLAITQRLVELLNGQIYMEDREGGGSEFYIVFDGVKVMQDEEFNRKQRMSLSINALNFFPATILIADDDQLNRDVIKGYLDEYPFSVVEAENGLQAVEQTKSQKPDLVLMDLKMPVVDGIEASRRIRDLSQFKDIPIIAITASAMKESLDKAKSICHSVLTKPVNKEKLLSEMAQFLRHAINQDNSEDKKISPENDEIVIDELTTQQIKNLPELISNLDGDLYNRWEDMTITLTIKDIQEFALEIQELGKKYNLNSLILWGDKLFQEANMFDIESLPDTLKKYPSFIQRLKAYIGDK
ncbi:MAG: ATP-binding protein, partial [Spirochaetota bacterium]|nr:ATP-binding protein [Spirochaetota bacterium]